MTDVIELGSPQRQPQRSRRAGIVVGVVALGLIVVAIQHDREDRLARSQREVILANVDGFSKYGEAVDLNLSVPNGTSTPATLKDLTVSPTTGVQILSVESAFRSGASGTDIVLPAHGRAELVIKYTVECAKVSEPWPYFKSILGEMTTQGHARRIDIRPDQARHPDVRPPSC